MGAVVDTSVLVDLEREARRRNLTDPMGLIGKSLEEWLGTDEEVAVAAITMSELVHGVHETPSEYSAR